MPLQSQEISKREVISILQMVRSLLILILFASERVAFAESKLGVPRTESQPESPSRRLLPWRQTESRIVEKRRSLHTNLEAYHSFLNYTKVDDSQRIYEEVTVLPSFLDNLTAGLAHRFGEHPENDRVARQSVGKSIRAYLSCNIWVAKTGGSNFRSIQAAVKSVGVPNKRRVIICVKPGTYYEQVHILPGQDYIKLLGSGKSTIISASNSQSSFGNNPYYPATLVVEGKNFIGAAFVVANTHFSTWDPAPAVAVMATQSEWQACAFKGWMDTLALYTGVHYFLSCYVEGKTDFIWGFGRGYFSNSVIYDKFIYGYIGYVTASGQDPEGGALPGGLVFQSCHIGGNGSAYLGRPYRLNATVTLISCYEGDNILGQGWDDWFGVYKYGGVKFKEINCYGPGYIPQQRQFCSLVTHQPSVPLEYTLDGFIGYKSWK